MRGGPEEGLEGEDGLLPHEYCNIDALHSYEKEFLIFVEWRYSAAQQLLSTDGRFYIPVEQWPPCPTPSFYHFPPI